MAITVCKYHQKGFCKYRDRCQHHHSDKICDNSSCDGSSCSDRHPQSCKFTLQKCPFQYRCAYRHDQIVTVDVVDKLKFQLTEAFRRIENLEKEITFLKETNHINISSNVQDESSKAVDVEDKMLLNTEETSDPTSFECEECDFKSNWNNGLKVHIARKHRSLIPQYDGGHDDVIADDEFYEGSKHYWKTHYLGGAYQSYIDAIGFVENIDIEENEKQMLKDGILDARKSALGASFSFYPPWS